jgi:3-methyladenine DNA glycosylase AlkD
LSREDVVDAIDAELRAAGSPERAAQSRAYLKSDSDIEHYGVTVPAMRAVVKAVAKEHRGWSHDDLTTIAAALWAEPVVDRRMAAVELLTQFVDRLEPNDLAQLEGFLREAKTWALVDALAASVVGAIVNRDPQTTGPVLDRWATDNDFWIRRSALLALLVPLRNGGGDFDRFSRYADAMLDEKEFFIRKAIGWVLRETAKKRADLVYAWLLPRANRASGVTIREAVKPLSEEQRAKILAAR